MSDELEALRAQVATLTAERDEALEQARQRAARDYLMESLEDPAARDAFCAEWANESVREERDAARAACVAKDAALRLAETDLSLCMTELSAETAHSLEAVQAALATDAGASILALLDECTVAVGRMMLGFFGAEPMSVAEVDDLLTRLKARGPSRFVSVEKVREVVEKVLVKVDAEIELSYLDALLAEVTT